MLGETSPLSYLEFGSSKISKAQVLDQTIFKRGCCKKKKKLFPKFSSGTRNFPHPLENLELALKFQIALDKIMMLWYE